MVENINNIELNMLEIDRKFRDAEENIKARLMKMLKENPKQTLEEFLDSIFSKN